MNVRDYIESGILETYVLGLASEEEAHELQQVKIQHPEVQQALNELEIDIERLAVNMAIVPPPMIWERIEKEVNNIIPAPEMRVAKPGNGQYTYTPPQSNGQQFIEVEGSSSHMRIHKSWKWVFAAVFVLGKIFLACAIYFYLENRQAQEQIKELKGELKLQQRVAP